jgi:hypothetical protein
MKIVIMPAMPAAKNLAAFTLLRCLKTLANAAGAVAAEAAAVVVEFGILT